MLQQTGHANTVLRAITSSPREPAAEQCSSAGRDTKACWARGRGPGGLRLRGAWWVWLQPRRASSKIVVVQVVDVLGSAHEPNQALQRTAISGFLYGSGRHGAAAELHRSAAWSDPQGSARGRIGTCGRRPKCHTRPAPTLAARTERASSATRDRNAAE